MTYYHEEHLTIRQYEVGADKRLRLDTMANFMEEAAGKHADYLGVGLRDLAAHGVSWVMTKVRMEIYSRPFAGECVTVRTWPCGMEKHQFRRDYIFYGMEPGDPMAAMSTQWVLFDLAQRKIASAVPPCVSPSLFENSVYALPDATVKVPPLRNGFEGEAFPVRLDDIDQNGHVNNVRYLCYVLNAAAGRTRGRRLVRLDLTFRAEARFDEILHSMTCIEEEEGPSLLHSIRRGDTELVRARTLWK